MKMKLLLLCLFLSVFETTAQKRFSLFLNSGYSFSNALQLNDEQVENSRGYISTFGGKMKLFSIKGHEVETGLAGKLIFSTGKVNGNKFNASTLRLVIPIQILFPLTEKWVLTTGGNLQNNIDLTTTDLKLGDKYLLRVDYLAGAKYHLNDEWALTGNVTINLRKIPDVYFLNDPKFAILLGVEKQFIRPRKIKS